MTAYLVAMYLVSLALGYVLAFTSTTLMVGRSLSDTGVGRGYQDAVTPPRFSTIAMLVYAPTLGGVIYGFWTFDWQIGIGIVIGLLVATRLNMALFLPKENGEHFRKLIILSMINRHADFLKSGDVLRASVMAELLAKLGIPVADFVDQLKKPRDA